MKTGRPPNVTLVIYEQSPVRFYEVLVEGQRRSTMWFVTGIRNSFLRDGERACPELAEGSGWGCERDYQAPLPLSSPVKGEEVRCRTSFNRVENFRRNNSVIFFFLIALLFV